MPASEFVFFMDARVEHQRRRNRLKQKRHRDRFTTERSQLLSQLAELRDVVATLATRLPVPAPTSTSCLPWKDVAAGLAQANAESRLTLQVLRDANASMQDLACTLATWVGQSVPSPSQLDDNPLRGLTALTLPADPEARKRGLDWYSQHLLFNTDRMLQLCGFPSKGTLHDVLVTDDAESGLSDILGRIQIEYNLPLHKTYSALADKIWGELRGDTHVSMSEFLDTETTAAIDPKMLYRRTPLGPRESNYYVCREFASDDRIVFLFGNFSQDVLHPINHMWRPRLFWYVLERVAPNQTRVRTMLYNGPKVVHGKVMTWRDDLLRIEQFAKCSAASSTTSHAFARYQHLVVQHGWQAFLDSVLGVIALPSEGSTAPRLNHCHRAAADKA
ncbi:hypothetical protein SPRG_15203 [Saprolegnia parasitica CBS 223.65]|uniref:BZIP domain-containing protein n=1 Tax=Saprolegnia parasitica (strain CBS 223.65) TaxID=695850 RepID=A0A067BKJ1_SAPPC|nr:hypothetical protein SPRG_15203 [Saprolegnia parasitica CBS 223.65]KDO18678.1 hypothetical protein SPRG_15203 [Saprolegnia parasitica CBS 223.65]|eukprot:XP_012210608.1 hypothetical protein SPRG_15203 [Saprolegnia parasitica CBS 223.65]